MNTNDFSFHSSNDPAHPSISIPEASRQFLTFTLDNEEYGVDIMQVREVKGWSETTRLPNSPSYIRGVLNLRGMILPIIDLRTRFTGQVTHATDKHVIIIIALSRRIIGVLADSVSDIITVSRQSIKSAPEMEQSSASEHRFIEGLIALEDRMVVLLDMHTLLHTDDVTEPLTSQAEETAA